MKVVTIKQPWATLIAEGYKVYEFRSWRTKYRGSILIHAGKGLDKKALSKLEKLNLTYPSSRILAKVDISDCIELDPLKSEKINSENELVYGSKERQGYAWKLENVQKINSNKEVLGKLSIWNIAEEDFK